MSQLGGVVLCDDEWVHCEALAVVGTFRPFRGLQVRKSASGVLECQQGDEIVPVLRFSEAIAGNTEPFSESAVFLTKLMRGGMSADAALALTNQVYRHRDHFTPVPDSIVQRFLETFRQGR